MRTPGHRRRPVLATARLPRLRLVVLVATALAAGCDYPFEPFQESKDGVFSMFGYLNTKADTQWVRVMPIRQSLFLSPHPIDAIVTLEQEGSGRTVTLNDSLFSFHDPQLGAVAYAHNFWTAEPLEPGTIYRVRAVRSDGATTTATVAVPHELEITYVTGPGFSSESALLRVRAPKLLLVEVFFAMMDAEGRRAQTIVVRQDDDFPTSDPAVRGIVVEGEPPERVGLKDARRQEIRLAVAAADWPFHPDMPDIAATLPGTAPSNVENGLGYVGGVTAWTIPFHRCVNSVGNPDRDVHCTTTFNGSSASIEGRLVGEGCSEAPSLIDLFLTESSTDGRVVTRRWSSGWDGSYRFEGIEPGVELALRVGFDGAALRLPVLGARERHRVQDIAVPCSPPTSFEARTH